MTPVVVLDGEILHEDNVESLGAAALAKGAAELYRQRQL
jgi:hypothetical protein